MGYKESQLALANLDQASRDMPVIMVEGGHDAAGHENCPLDVDSVVRQIVGLGGSHKVNIKSIHSCRDTTMMSK